MVASASLEEPISDTWIDHKFRHRSRRLAAVLLGAVAGVSPLAEAAVDALAVSTPRPFGYVIGDTFEHRISLVLEPGFDLDPASIPEPGRAGRWLTLDRTALESEAGSGSTRHAIVLRYQIVNAAGSLTGAGTPPVSLRIVGPEGDLPVVIPAWGFTVGPVVAPEERAPGRRPDLRPALPPAPYPTDARTARVAVLGLAALVLIVLIVRERLAWRLAANRAKHFDRAYRRLGRLAKDSPSGAYPDALVQVHAAFNATAGRAVFEHDLARFFDEHPRFEPLRTRIEALFTESARLFYGRDADPAASGERIDRLRDLCRACRDLERGR